MTKSTRISASVEFPLGPVFLSKITMIKEYRCQIDIIDSQIISLLEQREGLVKKIRLIKLQQDIPLKNLKREEQILEKSGKFKKVFIEILK